MIFLFISAYVPYTQYNYNPSIEQINACMPKITIINKLQHQYCTSEDFDCMTNVMVGVCKFKK